MEQTSFLPGCFITFLSKFGFVSSTLAFAFSVWWNLCKSSFQWRFLLLSHPQGHLHPICQHPIPYLLNSPSLSPAGCLSEASQTLPGSTLPPPAIYASITPPTFNLNLTSSIFTAHLFTVFSLWLSNLSFNYLFPKNVTWAHHQLHEVAVLCEPVPLACGLHKCLSVFPPMVRQDG